MGAIKCPICAEVMLMPGIKDGDMIRCSSCGARFTVTKYRRCSALVEELEKGSSTLLDEKKLSEFVSRLDDERLLIFVKLVTGELVDRYKKKDNIRERYIQESC
jgi:acetyl-CoA carboxylase beta subunit